jgi:hypothetical protein
MLHSYEAEVSKDGQVWLQEPLSLRERHRAVLTILEPVEAVQQNSRESPEPGDSAALLRFLRDNRLPDDARPSAAEIDAQITLERNAWD